MDVSVSLYDRIFANTIAFLLPGLAVMVGAATVNPVIVTWFGGASTNPTFVGFLFVVLAALTIGILLSAVRWWIFERCAWWPGCGGETLVPLGPPLNEAKRREHYAEYEDLRFQHYYHYLASANMAVAIPIAIATWLIGTATTPTLSTVTSVSVSGFILVYILKSAACEALTRYERRRLNLLGPQPTA